jgi:hypothetical protein
MRRAIVKILTDDRVNLDDFKKNPQMFMEGVSRIIIKNVRSMALKGIIIQRLEIFMHRSYSSLRNSLDI